MIEGHDIPLSAVYPRTQAAADALVAEALEDLRFAPRPDLRASDNVLRIVVGTWFVSGTLDFPRGWVRSVMVACRAAGAAHPNAKCIRWYRSKMRDTPYYFKFRKCIDSDLLDQMADDVVT
ncbi:MAG: hypothetical protein JJU07_16440 [Natronohydrobacter sp.]|nr:hypothetical protein [Natronohydrobacter sp.]